MQLVIRNYRAIDMAALKLGGITLVAGPNGAGKTSTAEALGALLSRTPLLVDGVLVKTADLVVRDGEAEATADLQFGPAEHDHLIATWPKAKVMGDLAGAPMASMIALGYARLSGKDKLADRVKLMERYVAGRPSDAEVAEALTEAGYSDKSIEHVQKRLKESTWDEMHRKAADNGTLLRGKWAGITREEFGTSKAEGWAPAGWVPVDDETVAKAQAEHDALVGERAVVMDRLPVLQAAIDKAEGIDLAAYKKAVADAEAAVATVEADRAALGSADDGIPCPHCGKPVTARADHVTKAISLFKSDATVSGTELKKLRLKIADAEGAVQRARSALSTARVNLDVATATVETAEKARADLASMADVDIEKVLAAKEMLADVLRRKADGERVTDAATTFADWKRNKKLVDMLAPEGLRRKAMMRDLAGFNARLASLCAAAGWPAVTVEPDFTVAMGGRPYNLLSKSTQYRADVTVQVACALADGSAVVVIDGADIMDKDGRNGLFMLLAEAEIPALVTMTFSAEKLVPDLAGAGLGRSYWLAAGRATPIGG